MTDFLHIYAGVPLYDSELGAMADRGLTAALARVNSVYAVSHLYRVTRGSVTKVSTVSVVIFELLLQEIIAVAIYRIEVVLCFIFIITNITCQVIPMGLNTVDLQMVLGIKETQCVKASRHDPQTCAFRPGFFVVRYSMSGILLWFVLDYTKRECNKRQKANKTYVLHLYDC